MRGRARRIAEVDLSPLRVLAGPGTGKTFALMRRAARLLQEGANPRRILVCTFTRTAARDMEGELSALGIEGLDAVQAGTLHAFSFGLLSREEVLSITGRNPRPMLRFEERFLLEDLQRPAFGGYRELERRLYAFNAAWARLQTDEPGWPSEPIDRDFNQELQNWLSFHQSILIGELIPETLRYLRENPASDHRGALDHVLVDEYQDLNRAEQVLLDLLAEAGTLTVIGDENQSIYSFKYAHPEGISTFERSHPGTHDESLVVCRRCPHLVVQLANTLITNNSSRIERELRPRQSNPDGNVKVVQWRSMEEEAEGIAQLIERTIGLGEVEAGGVLVLAPRRQLGYGVRDALNQLGVPAHSFFHEEGLDGNPKRIDTSMAQQAYTLLTLLANPNDSVALRCWCGFGSNSLRKGAWARLTAHCQNTGDSVRTVFGNLARGEIQIPYAGEITSRFIELQLRLEELNGIVGQDLVDALFPPEEAWAEQIRNLASGLEGNEFDAPVLREFLRVGITQPELPTDVDYVRVMSLHRSKGLNADLVVVVGCVEGIIPGVYDSRKTDLTEREWEEEQRRLFYVAITRTRNKLILSSITRLPRNMAHRMRASVRGGDRTHGLTRASRFLGDLGSSRPPAIMGSSLLRGN